MYSKQKVLLLLIGLAVLTIPASTWSKTDSKSREFKVETTGSVPEGCGANRPTFPRAICSMARAAKSINHTACLCLSRSILRAAKNSWSPAAEVGMARIAVCYFLVNFGFIG